MQKVLSPLALALAAFVASPASALSLVIDDFNQPAGQVTASDSAVGGGYAALFSHVLTGQIAVKRLVEENLLANSLALANPTVVTVGGGSNGFFNTSHDTGADSDVRITWTIAAFAPGAGTAALEFNVLFSNVGTPGTPLDLAFEFRDAGNVLQWTKNGQIGSVAATSVSYGLLASEASSMVAGGQLQLVLSGTPGYDLVFDQFNFVTTAVPEPGTPLLWAAGLAGMGVLCRARQRQGRSRVQAS